MKLTHTSDTNIQDMELLDNIFRPSEINEQRTPIQPVCIQMLDSDDTVIVNEGQNFIMENSL